MYDLYLKIYCFLSANASRMDKILLQRIGTDLDTLVRVWGGHCKSQIKEISVYTGSTGLLLSFLP